MFSNFKTILLLLALGVFSFGLNAQESKNNRTFKIDITLMSAASNHSRDSDEISVFVVAGIQLDYITVEELNKKFEKIMEKTGVGIDLKIQRTDKRKGSSFDFFVDGQSVGSTVGNKGLKEALAASIKKYKDNRNQSASE